MRHKDYSGESYYLIPIKDNVLGDAFKVYPWSADIAMAHVEGMRLVKEIKEKQKVKCQAV